MVRGAKTIAQYKILRWLEQQNFDRNSFAVSYIDTDKVAVVDKFGAKIILKYTEESGVEEVSTLASIKAKETQVQMEYISTKKRTYER